MADFEKIVNDRVKDGAIPSEAISGLVTAIKTAVGNEYVDKERYKAKLSEIDSLNEKVQTAEDNSVTAEKWKEKYDKEHEAFDAYKKQIADKESEQARLTAARKFFEKANIVGDDNLEIVLRGSKDEISALKLKDDGTIEDTSALDALVKGVYAKFVTTTETRGADTPNPANNTGGNTFEQMNLVDKMRYANEHPNDTAVKAWLNK